MRKNPQKAERIIAAAERCRGTDEDPHPDPLLSDATRSASLWEILKIARRRKLPSTYDPFQMDAKVESHTGSPEITVDHQTSDKYDEDLR